MLLILIQIFILICGFCSRLHTIDSHKEYFVIEGSKENLTLKAPDVQAGTEICWTWTSHDRRNINTSIACVNSTGHQIITNTDFHLASGHHLSMFRHFENAGKYILVQIKPTFGILGQFEVFVLKAYSSLGKSEKGQRGSDVTLRCEVSLLSDSSTLQWERNGPPTSNTTLMYNNSVYIILHNIDEYSGGEYHCRLIENGTAKASITQSVDVSVYTIYRKTRTIYRETNNSYLSLSCNPQKTYKELKWTWDKKSNELITSEGQNQTNLTLNILPVWFNKSGKYLCIGVEVNYSTTYSTTILHVLRVRAEPPGGALRNQSVVLTCEVSDVTEPVTLAWLRMKGNRAVLVKEQILTETNKKRTLTVHMTSAQTDQLNWQCAVFARNVLRALVSRITISSDTNASGISTQLKITVTAVTLCAGILLGVLLYYWCKEQMSGVTSALFSSITFHSEAEEPVYINIHQLKNERAGNGSLGNRQQTSEIHPFLSRNRYGKVGGRRDEFVSSQMPVTSESVTYATIDFNRSRQIQTYPSVTGYSSPHCHDYMNTERF